MRQRTFRKRTRTGRRKTRETGVMLTAFYNLLERTEERCCCYLCCSWLTNAYCIGTNKKNPY